MLRYFLVTDNEASLPDVFREGHGARGGRSGGAHPRPLPRRRPHALHAQRQRQAQALVMPAAAPRAHAPWPN